MSTSQDDPWNLAGDSALDAKVVFWTRNTNLGSPLFVACYEAACLLVFAVVTIRAWAGLLPGWLPPMKSKALELYIYVTCAGGLGAVVYCMRGLYMHVSQGDYKPSHHWAATQGCPYRRLRRYGREGSHAGFVRRAFGGRPHRAAPTKSGVKAVVQGRACVSAQCARMG